MGDDDVEYCKVYDAEDSFTGLVQALLALIALASLYIKRSHEVPMRTFMTWWLDVSKQGIGAVYAHCSNMVIAAMIVDHARGDYDLEDQCAWYAMSFLVDTTLGLFVSLCLLGLLTSQAKKRGWTTLQNNGVYEGKEGLLHWWHQVLAWVLILTVVRFVVAITIWIFSPILSRVGDLIFTPLQGNIKFELLFVMIIFPGVLNFFYFWVADQFLKAGPEHTSAHEQPTEDEGIEGSEYHSTDASGNVKNVTSVEMSKAYVKPTREAVV